MPTRRSLLLGALAAAACPAPAPATPAARGAAWLLARQGADGSFRSETYGFLRSGASLTGLCLLALAATPSCPRGPLDRGLGFLLGARQPSGALGLGGDYPVYATSLGLSALAALRPPGWEAAAAPSVAWLLGQQLRGEGWGEHPGRGGFPMGASEPRTPPSSGHVDLSMTRRALQALVACGLPSGHEALAEGRRFALRCRAADGGFRYSPVEPGVNKGEGPEASYGTATADGVLALRAAGGAAEEVGAGLRWLGERFRPDANPGVGGPFAAYGPAMRFYWRAGAAEALAAGEAGGSAGPSGWREALRSALEAEQREDGAWRNERAEQKEDDPLIATALALLALAAAG